MSGLTPGQVIILKNFKLHNFGEGGKYVWMIYLGRDDIMQCNINVYCHRFTSQVNQYTSGARTKNNTIYFEAGAYGIFRVACILDFNERPYQIPKDHFDKIIDKNSINNFPPLPPDVIRRIWNIIVDAPHYNKRQLKTIRDNLHKAGIYGLKI